MTFGIVIRREPMCCVCTLASAVPPLMVHLVNMMSLVYNAMRHVFTNVNNISCAAFPV